MLTYELQRSSAALTLHHLSLMSTSASSTLIPPPPQSQRKDCATSGVYKNTSTGPLQHSSYSTVSSTTNIPSHQLRHPRINNTSTGSSANSTGNAQRANLSKRASAAVLLPHLKTHLPPQHILGVFNTQQQILNAHQNELAGFQHGGYSGYDKQVIPTPCSNGSEFICMTDPHYKAMDAFEDFPKSNESDEYAFDSLDFMKSLEVTRIAQFIYTNKYTKVEGFKEKCMPLPCFIENQPELTWRMRKTLISWLIEVHAEYDLRQETLYLAINMIDRVCSKVRIARHQYQLLGIASLWIASKYEENHGKVPSLKNLTYICCNSYCERDFVDMERMILRELGFHLGVPTVESFLKAYCTMYFKGIAREVRALGRYIMELTLLHRRFIHQKPSVIALASLILANEILELCNPYYSDERLALCIEQLSDCLIDPPEQLLKKVLLQIHTNTQNGQLIVPQFSSDKFLNSSLTAKIWADQVRYRSTAEYEGLLTPPKDESNYTPTPLPNRPMLPMSSIHQTYPPHPFLPGAHPTHATMPPIPPNSAPPQNNAMHHKPFLMPSASHLTKFASPISLNRSKNAYTQSREAMCPSISTSLSYSCGPQGHEQEQEMQMHELLSLSPMDLPCWEQQPRSSQYYPSIEHGRLQHHGQPSHHQNPFRSYQHCPTLI